MSRRSSCLRLLIACLSGLLSFIPASGQQDDDADSSSVQFNRMDRATVNFPTTFYAGVVKGSPWYSPRWVQGQVNFADGHSLPLPGDVLFINYDKSLNKLFFRKGDSITAFRNSELRDFQLNDSLGVHSFARVSQLSTSGFFEILTESRTGFSLYRKMFSRLRPPDYATVGYSSTGSKSPYYVDASQYYLLYPDRKKFTRFSLSHAGLRKKLAGINPVARKFMEEHPEEITHQLLLRLCDVLNE